MLGVVGARARLLVLLVVASLLASVSGFARVLYVCRMSGRVAPSCCCAHGMKAPSRHAALRRADCCEEITIQARASLASAAAEGPDLPLPALAVQLPVSPPPRFHLAVGDGWSPHWSRGPPDTGPPLYLRNCTLLT
jgi:hypothetical protein